MGLGIEKSAVEHGIGEWIGSKSIKGMGLLNSVFSSTPSAQAYQEVEDLFRDKRGHSAIMSRLGSMATGIFGGGTSVSDKLVKTLDPSLVLLVKFADPELKKTLSAVDKAKALRLMNSVHTDGTPLNKMFTLSGMAQFSEAVDQGEATAMETFGERIVGRGTRADQEFRRQKGLSEKDSEGGGWMATAKDTVSKWFPQTLNTDEWSDKQWTGAVGTGAALAAGAVGLYNYFSDDDDDKEPTKDTTQQPPRYPQQVDRGQSYIPSQGGNRPSRRDGDASINISFKGMKEPNEWSKVYAGIDY